MNRSGTKVAIVKTGSRPDGVDRALALLGSNPVREKAVLLKPNFNSADPFPGSTHPETLLALIRRLREMGAASITLGERSGPGSTAKVMEAKGIYGLCGAEGVGIINFEDLPDHEWVRVKPEQSHWRNGFEVARAVVEAECIVSTCCLKTHAYGGVFTLSLKLAVGVTHKRNMMELHSSARSMRKMIAEINQAFRPSLILLDGLEAFVDGGPATGKLRRAGLMAAGTDRVAVDAVGLAILKQLGSNDAIMKKKIFCQEQIARAVELGLGVAAPEAIELVSDDDEGRAAAEELKQILLQG